MRQTNKNKKSKTNFKLILFFNFQKKNKTNKFKNMFKFVVKCYFLFFMCFEVALFWEYSTGHYWRILVLFVKK
jgi:hypothetical protein